jgi:hypothetical protein
MTITKIATVSSRARTKKTNGHSQDVNMKITVTILVLYLWAAFGTGLVVSRLYRPDEKNSFVGPVAWGIGWPVFLPVVAFGMAPPPWHNPTLGRRDE